MLVNLILYAIGFIVGVFIDALAAVSSYIDTPSALLAAVSGIGYYIGLVANILPNGMLGHMVSALSLVVTVNLLVIPWMAARNFRLPFGALTKKE